MDQIIPMTALNARRVRILKESEEKLAQHVKSRDNTTILEFLDNVNDNDRASLFQSAVLKLTCNNDADTLGAVLDYGKEKTLDVQWTEDDKGKEKKLDVQWTEVDEGKKKSQDFEEWLKEEGRRNPIMVASEQGFLQCTKQLYKFGFRIPNIPTSDTALPGEQEKFRSKLVIKNQGEDDQVSKFLAMQAYAKPHYIALGLTEDDRIDTDIEKEEDPEKMEKILHDLEKLDPLRRALTIAEKAENLNATAGRASNLNCDYLAITEELDKFASGVLTQCKNMEEVEDLLEHRPASKDKDGRTWKQSSLKKALGEGRKEFVAHPYYQEYFHKQMTGATNKQIKPDSQRRVLWRMLYFPYVLFLFCCYPVVVFADFFRNADILFVKPKDSLGKAGRGVEETTKGDNGRSDNAFFAFFRREMHTPNFRMTIHVTIQVLYMLLLLIMIWNPTEEFSTDEGSKKKHVILYWIVLAVTAILFLEGIIDFCMNMKEKENAEFFESIWNVWDLGFRLVLLVGLVGFLISDHSKDMEGSRVLKTGNDEINVSFTLVCLGVSAEFFKSLRLLLLFKSFGALVICMINVIKDAAAAAPIYFVIFSTYSIFMWGMLRPFHQAFRDNEQAIKKKFVTPDAAESRDGLFHTLFWKVLTAANQGEMQLRYKVNGTTTDPPESYASHEFSHTFILVAWAFYQFTIYLLMLNLLIAIMNNTFARCQGPAADIYWKYSKTYYQAQFLREKTTFPSPFQWFFYLACFVHYCRNGTMDRDEKLAQQSPKRKNYLKLLKKLLEIKLHIDLENTSEDKLADLRKDINLDMDRRHLALKEELDMAGMKKDINLIQRQISKE